MIKWKKGEIMSVTLKEFKIDKLFGMFNHNIKLNTEEKITIVHGPNGVGKTTILKIIKNVLDQKFYLVLGYNFESLSMYFTDGSILGIKRKIHDEEPELTVRLKSGDIDKSMTIKSSDTERNRKLVGPVGIIDDIIPDLDRIGPRKWINKVSGEHLDLSDIVIKYADDYEIIARYFGSLSKTPDEIHNFLKSVNVHFIQTQRLLTHNDKYGDHYHRKNSQESTIEKYSNEMASILRKNIQDSGSVSADLDRTFPNRLLTASESEDYNETQIRDNYLSQNEYRNRLMKAGLINEEEPVQLPGRTLSNSDLKLLHYYLSDVDKKFQIFDSLLKRVELFKDIINSRFLYKSFTVDRNEGFIFISNTGRIIPLKALSSGEQHELVLAFELIFIVPSETTILIDEPELSLHVTWQNKFLDDLERISSLNEMYFLIATHSPSIVGDKGKLMITIPTEVIDV
jgi:predicted ATP-binding protein involved in virulence